MPPRTGARRRLGSIRLSLILLALVPCVTLAGLWGLTTIRMFSEGLELRSQTQLSRSTGAMGTHAALDLQRERALTADWLAGPDGSRSALVAQRRATDRSVARLMGQADAIAEAPARISDRLYSVLGSVGSLEYYRDQIDNPRDITAEEALEQYTSVIDDQIHAFQELSQVDDGDLTSQAQPLVALEHAVELVSREDALLTLAWPSGRLDSERRQEFAALVHTRRWLVGDQIVPLLSGDIKTQTERILQSPEWRALEAVEDQVLATPAEGEAREVELPDLRDRWDAAMAEVAPQYSEMIRQQTDALLARSADEARGLLVTAASLSAAGLLALLLCVGLSWRITRSLSRRLRGLRLATLSLAQERLPDVVARLERGEKVDPESATTPLDYGHDELGQVAQAFNTAQRTAVLTTVELADTRRGFQKIILGIARQSQNLVNLQLSKLDTLERRHTDPEVLKGLYELDSVASQLRRYEENLVIVSGERPGRSWSEPVALIDILRSAVGEVAEYQRVEVFVDEEVSLAPPAVADVIHLLAELIDNATVYSPAPSPVTVRAAMVAKGLAVEVEDRGLGMPEEDYASLNAQLAEPPQFDVVALADDLRLGMFVISQLAHRHGIAVTLRPSPYGGTTAIVLLPHEVVVSDGQPDAARGTSASPTATEADTPSAAPLRPLPARDRPDAARRAPASAPGDSASAGAQDSPAAGEDAGGAQDGRGATEDLPDATRAGSGPGDPRREPAASARNRSEAAAVAPGPHGPAPRKGGLAPLPRRVPQTSLAAELLEDPAAADSYDDDFTAERAASSLSCFQQGTFRARDAVGDVPERDVPERDVPEDDDAGPTVPDGPPRVPAPSSGHPTPTADADR
ncbi:nitrate- and nitrite sensing domain-containing protein [Streptomyces sp. MA15]|uniref:sensor histidine kinase n=1 Tax=Streptomyces sp. MA15 TaxID=3055061 RepID=UPI0025B0A71F|nr:nitrate- and nitrite sensing domain-containing protein [Streptomyces sp. MA15]MDN3269626.1 nitrate- and nitrite sensing domain-containing protein [Streptomyces sp. MA15]